MSDLGFRMSDVGFGISDLENTDLVNAEWGMPIAKIK